MASSICSAVKTRSTASTSSTGAIRPFYDIGGGLLPGLVRTPDEGDDGSHEESDRHERPDRPGHLAVRQRVVPRPVGDHRLVLPTGCTGRVGHVFREGHTIVVLVHAPPLVDSYYAYAPVRAPTGINTIHVGGDFTSSIMLPVVPLPASWDLDVELGCGKLEAVRCVPAP